MEKLPLMCNYHNFRIEGAHKLCDKYVKGLEYPVVVIEGFPRFMDKADEESKMWSFRRELYLCASRATCFLYLICNAGETTGEDACLKRIKQEIARLVDAVAMPTDPYAKGVREWKFNIKGTTERRKLSVFDELNDKTETKETPTVPALDVTITPVAVAMPSKALTAVDSKSVCFTAPPTVKELATALNLKLFQLNRDLIEMNYFAAPNQILDFDVVAAICAKHNKTYISDNQINDAVVVERNISDNEPSKNKMFPKSQDADIITASPSQSSSDYAPIMKGQVVDLISPRRAKRGDQSSLEARTTLQAESFAEFPQKIDVSETMSVMQFARMLGVQHRDVINWLVRQGQYATGSYLLDAVTMRSIAREYKLGINVLQ